jgi:hypothetical protein
MKPKLIILNGPLGIGKSTLAKRYAGNHPLTLTLDIDDVWAMLGHWREERAIAQPLSIKIAIEMARIVLLEGHDVIVPQIIQDIELLFNFEKLAETCGASYHEILLYTDKHESIRRFITRGKSQGHPTGFREGGTIANEGREKKLAQMYDDMIKIARQRAKMVIVVPTYNNIEMTYSALLANLANQIVGVNLDQLLAYLAAGYPVGIGINDTFRRDFDDALVPAEIDSPFGAAQLWLFGNVGLCGQHNGHLGVACVVVYRSTQQFLGQRIGALIAKSNHGQFGVRELCLSRLNKFSSGWFVPAVPRYKKDCLGIGLQTFNNVGQNGMQGLWSERDRTHKPQVLVRWANRNGGQKQYVRQCLLDTLHHGVLRKCVGAEGRIGTVLLQRPQRNNISVFFAGV